MREFLLALFFLRGLTGLFLQFDFRKEVKVRQDVAMTISTSSQFAIEINGLTKHYGDKVAVDALLADVQLPASEIDWCGFHGVGVYMGQFARFWVFYGTVRNFRMVGQFIG